MSLFARLPVEVRVQPIQQSPIAGMLVVRERDAGPVLFAKWRDGERKQVMRRLGPAWLVPVNDSRAKGRGARVGGWVERRGRAPEEVLDVRAAHDAMRRAIDERELALLQEHQRAARVRESGVTVRRGGGRVAREGSHRARVEAHHGLRLREGRRPHLRRARRAPA
jgi:hypothetical protein